MCSCMKRDDYKLKKKVYVVTSSSKYVGDYIMLCAQHI